MSDLTYTKQGLFTVFFPETKEGEYAWNEIAEVSDGSGKVLTVQLDSVLCQLRKAGYSVTKAKKSKLTMDDIFSELEELGL